MVTRRKYKTGGRVLADVPIEDDPEPARINTEQAVPSPRTPPQAVAPLPDDGSPLMHALEAARRADDLQRQAAKRSPVDRMIDGIPDISDHKRQFLRQYPELLNPAMSPVMGAVYHAALRDGVPDDSKAMDEAIVSGVVDHFRQLEHRTELTSADARPTPENRAMHAELAEAAEELDREAELLQADGVARSATPPPAARRSIPVSAPVSRDAPMPSGERRPSQITLNRDEREIAHTSFRHLSPAQAELEYAKNKKLMLAMKADGRIQGDR